MKAMQLIATVPVTLRLSGGEDGVRLLRNLQRLKEQSEILERRRVQHSIQVNADDFALDASAAAAAAAAPGLRACNLRACTAREQHRGAFKACGACRGVVYCCKEHQTAHWPAHKAACKASRKAAVQQAEADT